jgi:hypothetical protein
MFITAGHEHAEYVMVIACVRVADNVIPSVVAYESISSTETNGSMMWQNTNLQN